MPFSQADLEDQFGSLSHITPADPDPRVLDYAADGLAFLSKTGLNPKGIIADQFEFGFYMVGDPNPGGNAPAAEVYCIRRSLATNRMQSSTPSSILRSTSMVFGQELINLATPSNGGDAA